MRLAHFLITEPAPGRFDEFAFREAGAPPCSPRPEAVPESVDR